MEKLSEKVRKIFYRLNNNEQYGLSFGLFPVRLSKCGLKDSEFSELIRISQRTTGVRY